MGKKGCASALQRQMVIRRVEQFVRLVFQADSFHRYASQEILFDSKHYLCCVSLQIFCFINYHFLYLNYIIKKMFAGLPELGISNGDDLKDTLTNCAEPLKAIDQFQVFQYFFSFFF